MWILSCFLPVCKHCFAIVQHDVVGACAVGFNHPAPQHYGDAAGEKDAHLLRPLGVDQEDQQTAGSIQAATRYQHQSVVEVPDFTDPENLNP